MEYAKLLDEAETKYGLPKGLLHSQMQAESNGNPNVKSPVGAVGLMQFMPDTAAQYGIDPLDPAQSIDGAGRYMRDLVKQTGNTRSALAAYNWGIGNLKRKGIDNMPDETRNYIDKVSKGMKTIAKAGLNGVVTTAHAEAGPNTNSIANASNINQSNSFNPDAYLANKAPKATTQTVSTFDPDAYLSSKTSQPKKDDGIFSGLSLSNVPGNLKNLVGGAAEGIGQIGATIAQPIQYAAEKLFEKPPTMAEMIAGKHKTNSPLGNNAEMRDNIAKNLRAMGVDTDSGLYTTGKLGAEIAATLPVGGAIGKVVGKVAPALGEAIASGGFSLGKAPAASLGESAVNALTRVAGGAINGGATVGLVNPDDAATGAIVGGAFPIAAKVAGETGKAVGAAVRPLYEKGREAILGERLLEQAGANPGQVIQNLKAAKGSTPGFNPTVGQAAGSDELATMERVMRGAAPGAFQDTMEGQTKALANAVRQHGGDDVQRQLLVDARANASEPLFNAANSQQVQMTPEIEALMQRPSMQQATSRAGTIASEKGIPFDLNNLTGADAQRIKMGLDDLVNTGGQSGLGANELNAIRDTKGNYLSELEKQIPAYLEGNRAFKAGSEPINQMDLGNAIADKFIPASQRDMDIPISLNYETLAKALRDNGDGIAKKATGFKGATLANTASPAQLESYQNVLNDIEYVKQGMRGKMAGSDTFQNLLFNAKTKDGILANIPVFKGLSAASLLRVRDFIYKQPNEALQQKLLTVLQDPNGAALLMESAQKGSATPGLVRMLKSPAIINATEVMLAE
ncbi:transglycosylase SLT domain-containing protein [Methylophilus flavus]|uniref:Transglycosylase SLT domain-containing protein n=1 Tax=Methylophilus flavus TaxID=640084 RepID=A0ABW3PC28_9PROT